MKYWKVSAKMLSMNKAQYWISKYPQPYELTNMLYNSWIWDRTLISLYLIPVFKVIQSEKYFYKCHIVSIIHLLQWCWTIIQNRVKLLPSLTIDFYGKMFLVDVKVITFRTTKMTTLARLIRSLKFLLSCLKKDKHEITCYWS